VLNPATPFGDRSLIRIANLQANILQISHSARLRDCLAMLTERSARLLNLKDYGLVVGNPADIVVIVLCRPSRRWPRSGSRLRSSSGRRSVIRHPPELVRQ
jgi:cytosine/creatinine deaminase